MNIYTVTYDPQPIAWKQTTESRYWEMLEVLPPASQNGFGFLVGEPSDHRQCTVNVSVEPMARFVAFVEVKGKFYESARPLTVAEFRAFWPADVNVAA